VRRHDEVGAHEAAPRGDEPADQGCRDAEGRVGDDVKRLPGQPEIRCVGHDDDNVLAREELPEPSGTALVKLHGDDAGPRSHEWSSERADAGTDVENEVTGGEASIAHQARRPAIIELVVPPPGG
jgi:hypothetical protein